MAFTLNVGYKGAMISALSIPMRPKEIREFYSWQSVTGVGRNVSCIKFLLLEFLQISLS